MQGPACKPRCDETQWWDLRISMRKMQYLLWMQKVVDAEEALGRSPVAKEWASYMVAKCQSLGLPFGKNPELGLREIQELSKFLCL